MNIISAAQIDQYLIESSTAQLLEESQNSNRAQQQQQQPTDCVPAEGVVKEVGAIILNPERPMLCQQAKVRAAPRSSVHPQHNGVWLGVVLGLQKPENISGYGTFISSQ